MVCWLTPDEISVKPSYITFDEVKMIIDLLGDTNTLDPSHDDDVDGDD